MLWYIVFGFLLLRLFISVVNYLTFARTSKLNNLGLKQTISILIPARNEEKNIGRLLDSLANQKFPLHQILVLDDDSSDKTPEIVMSYQHKLPQLILLKGDPLPKDWLGKTWACHQLAGKATGDYMIFLDADVEVKSGLFEYALNEMNSQKLSLFSIFPTQRMESWGEKLIVPLMNYLLLSLLALPFIKWFGLKSLSAANGQFLCFEKSTYNKLLPHLKQKSSITEDIEIMKYYKRNKFRCNTVPDPGFISCRMYYDLKSGLDGFSKNVLSGFGNSIIAMLSFLFLIWGAYPFIIAEMTTRQILFSISSILLIRILISKISRQEVIANLVLHPLQMVLLIYICMLSILKRFRKNNQWKGRNIQLQ